MSTDITGPFDGGFPTGTPGKRDLRGNPARWNETAKWIDRDGLPLPSPMLVAGFTTELRCWKDKKLERITEHPLPDPAQLNKAIPISKWETGLDGRPRAPWALTYVVYLVNLNTGALYTYANSTFGARLLYENLEEQVTVMRMIRGNHVLPIVNLEQRPMKTQYGMKTRPHLHIIDWRAPGRDDGSGQPKPVPQAPTPQIGGPTTPTPTPTTPATPRPTPTTPPPAPPPAAASTPPSSTILDHTKPVKPVTVGELIADELPPWA
jgi:hypothetical protein